MINEMSSWIRATSDIMVRVLLGQEENTPVLKDFINAVLDDRGYPLLDNLVIKNPTNMKDVFDSKESVLDVKAQDESGCIYDIEIQTTQGDAFIDRSLYYWSKLYSGQLKEGEKYKTLNPVICINILNYIQFDFKSDNNPHSCFMIRDLDSENILTEKLQLHYLELPRVKPDLKRKPKSRLEKWLWYFIEEGEVEEEDMKNIVDDRVFVKVHSTFKQFTASDEFRERYEARMKIKRDRAQEMYEAREKGLKMGIEQGIEKGKEIERNKINRAHASVMKKNGIDIQIISEVTGLTEEEINNIQS